MIKKIQIQPTTEQEEERGIVGSTYLWFLALKDTIKWFLERLHYHSFSI
jgi:hypothetical protein